ncbi:MAG TPA: hypothetical protein VLA85_23150 [Verrucomicrobiae bacterium]|jgi:hypothetical protein|nr:hypothetical protein [Verrucomicrobiae bacterium]
MIRTLPLVLDPRFRGDDDGKESHRLDDVRPNGEDMRRKSRMADDLLASLKQALDHAKGKPVAMRISHVTTEPTKVRKLKKSRTTEKRCP